MARQTLRNNPKFKRLVNTLGVPVPHARGYLELLWDSAGECGNPVIGDVLDVELACDWPGERGALHAALLECRLIDEVEPGKYAIHDFFDHCPRYVLERAKREAARCQEGKTISDQRREAANKRWHPDRENMQNNATGCKTEPFACKQDAKVTTPSPTPTQEIPHVDEDDASKSASPSDSDFLTAWNSAAAAGGFRTAREMTDKRGRALRERRKKATWRETWRQALDQIGKLPFLCGSGDRGWRAHVDWFLRPDTVVKILEGEYGDPKQSAAAKSDGNAELERTRQLLQAQEQFRRKAS